MNIEIDKCGARRTCRKCSLSMNKGDTVIIEDTGNSFGHRTYNNYCIFCAVNMLKDVIKHNVEILNSIIKEIEEGGKND